MQKQNLQREYKKVIFHGHFNTLQNKDNVFIIYVLFCDRRENENNEKRIAALEAKISASTRKVAKLELNSKKSDDIMAELKSQNQKIVERNAQLVDKFTQELSKISSGDRNAIDGKSLAMKSKVGIKSV